MHTENNTNNIEKVMSAVLIDLSCYIHEIPLNVYRLVCIQLDQKERWQRLARAIGCDCMEIEKIRQSNSPATKLLSKWSDEKHTVTELYMALHQIGEFRIMEHLIELVDGTYHRLLNNTSKLSTKISSVSSTKSHNSDNSELKRRQHSKKTILDTFKSSLNSLDNYNIGLPRIPFNDLSTATGYWDTDKVLGTGGYSTVYHGNWKMTKVAIKRFNCQGFDRSETIKNRLRSIVTELNFLNQYRHDNILPLYGYSFEGTSACLVYQMMANGSLEQCLQQKKIRLTYKQRLNIAIGTARGLQFLHTSDSKRPTVHGDIKSANILLDSNFQPKIGDFGLAHHANGTTKSKRIYGTRPYMADDFFETMIISPKNDIFSMGVVLFELATSLPAYDEGRGKLDLLPRLMRSYCDTPENLVKLIDARERRHSSRALPILMELIKIGFSCTKSKAMDRPEMSVVLNSLLKL